MNKSARFIVYSSMICMMISIISITFTLAWYAMYPTFNDISITALDNSVRIENQVYLRNTNKETGLPGFGYLSFNEANEEQYIDYNIKTEDKFHEPTINGELQTSSNIEINFNALNYKLFNFDDLDLSENNLKTNFFDPVTCSFNLDYFTFAIFQIKYLAETVESYVQVNYELQLSLTNKNNELINDEYFLNNYANSIFKLHIINDYLDVEDDVNPNNLDTYEKDGFRLDMIGDPNNALIGSYQYENIKELNNFYGPNNESSNNQNAEYLSIIPNNKYPLYKNYQTTYAIDSANPNQIRVKVNPNATESNQYYSHATTLSLSFNPIVMMQFLKDSHYTNSNKPILKPTLSFDFEISNVEFKN